ncbi:FAD-dependent monooxygenase [Streptomyces chilikensis]|uniref:FAD-dependent monooxygenase n=1 Tax=Streptomyces chilikensis TaxID=1194079 RepID=A0ABV3ELI0_9ACTN
MNEFVTEHPDVVIVGAGPVGLMLAAELHLSGVRPLVVDSAHERAREPKAGGIVGQVVRLLDHRGLYQRITGDTEPPRPLEAYLYGGMTLRLHDWPENQLYGFTVNQWDLETRLEERALELGAEIRRGSELIGFEQDADGVTVRLTTGTVRTRYLIGCDGARSRVRRQSGIVFTGTSSPYPLTYAADAVLSDEHLAELTDDHSTPVGLTYRRTEHGVFACVPASPGTHRVVTMEWDRPEEDEPVTFDQVRSAVTRVTGREVPMRWPTGTGTHLLRRRTGTSSRLAEHYRLGRVFLAGDAAHAHSSVGAPGLNLGLQDAANLGWKLAAELGGWAPPGLLDTYHAERHLAGRRVMSSSRAQSALLAPGADVTALREVFDDLLAEPAATRRIAAMMSGSDVVHPSAAPGGHPSTGRWVADLRVNTDGGSVRLAERARHGRPMLLCPPKADTLADTASPWSERVDLLTVTAAPGAPPRETLLVRPDGYVAWAGTEPAELTAALRTWFGPPSRHI